MLEELQDLLELQFWVQELAFMITVIMVMMNNGPFFPKVLKKSLFANYPNDIRPSRFAHFMAAFGHISEFAIPFILFTAAASAS